MAKARLSVTVDEELVAAGRAAVAAGHAASLSEWVEAGLRLQAHHDRLLEGGRRYAEWYDQEFGEITDEEIAEAEAHFASRAIEVRPTSVAS